MPSAARRGAGVGQTESEEHVMSGPSLTHEEGHEVSPTEHAGSRMLGESLGPFPTAGAGNTGPQRQSAQGEYATGTHQPGDIVFFAVRPGRINLGFLTPPLFVPVSAVRSVSLERVVLDVTDDETLRRWQKRADHR